MHRQGGVSESPRTGNRKGWGACGAGHGHASNGVQRARHAVVLLRRASGRARLTLLLFVSPPFTHAAIHCGRLLWAGGVHCCRRIHRSTARSQRGG